MALPRWKFGSYTFEYNPKTDERTLSTSAGEVTSVGGIVSNPNLTFTKSIDFSIDLYDKPTNYASSSISSFVANKYIGIAEKRASGELFCIRSGAVDVFTSGGGIVRTATFAFTGTPLCIAHLDSKLAFIMKTSSTTGDLYITDENCVQISKYSITDADYLNITGIAWDYVANLYILNKYGKIFQVVVATGANSLIKQFDDFTANQSATKDAYYNIHVYKGFIGYTRNTTLTYMDNSYQPMYGVDIPYRSDIPKILSLSFGDYTGSFSIITSTKIFKFFPNVCGVDIERIRKEIANGLVQITDDKSSIFFACIHTMDVTHQRNQQEMKYEVSLSGDIY